MTNTTFKHITVLLQETINQVLTDINGTYVDCTAGGGGHIRYLLQKLGPGGKIIAFDQDPGAISHLKTMFAETLDSGKLTLINEKFSNVKKSLATRGIQKVAGIYADLGVSSPQIDQSSRGFSFQKDGPLDMRMDQNSDLETAASFVNSASLDELRTVFKVYGEEPKAHYIASAIVAQRQAKPFETTLELADVVRKSVFYSKKSKKHPATKVFQAIRIHINQEISELETLLRDGPTLLDKHARFAIISFHSLEDRAIKNAFKKLAGREKTPYIPKEFAILKPESKNIEADLIKPFPITPSEQELEDNPRSRSAKLRVCQML